MNTTDQLWKFSWNPAGYKIADMPMDITNRKGGDYFSLNHTYFNIKDFNIYTVSSTGSKTYYKCHEKLLATTDFLFDKRDEILSNVAGVSVYSRIKVISTRATKLTKIFVDCNFLADVIDPSSFNQDLTQDSDVEHKSLTVKDKIVAPVGHFEEVKGMWGNINVSSTEIKSTSIKLGNTFLSDSGYLIDSAESIVTLGKKNFNISFDEKNMTASLQVGAKRDGILIRGPKTAQEIPVFGIPVILSDDKTRWGFVPWLTLDPVNKGIKIGSLNVEDNSLLTSTSLEIGKTLSISTIKLNAMSFIDYNRDTGEVSMLDGMIKVNVITRSININGITIDGKLLPSILQLQKDVEYLKARVK